MTTWYEGYYDIWLGGQYYKKIGELHEKYGQHLWIGIDIRVLTRYTGPVVRINPHEIHCNDPEFIDSIYAGSSRKTDKYRFTGRKTLTKQSMVAVSIASPPKSDREGLTVVERRYRTRCTGKDVVRWQIFSPSKTSKPLSRRSEGA